MLFRLVDIAAIFTLSAAVLSMSLLAISCSEDGENNDTDGDTDTETAESVDSADEDRDRTEEGDEDYEEYLENDETDFEKEDLPDPECLPMSGEEHLPDCGHMLFVADGLDHETCVIVPDGRCYRYWMGNVENDYYARANEFPRHQVDLTAYSMSRYPVTVREYRACVDAGVCSIPTEEYCYRTERDPLQNAEPNYDDPSRLEHPVTCIALAKAERFCNWLGGNLPTEARFEFAATGPMTDDQHKRYFPWGDDTSECHVNILGEDPFAETSPVGFFDGLLKTREEGGWIFGPDSYQTCNDSSPFGLRDLTHNCIEIVADGPSHYEEWPENSKDPFMDSYCDGIQVRGSGWSYAEIVHTRVYNRREFCVPDSETPPPFSIRDDIGFAEMGFRCAF